MTPVCNDPALHAAPRNSLFLARLPPKAFVCTEHTITDDNVRYLATNESPAQFRIAWFHIMHSLGLIQNRLKNRHPLLSAFIFWGNNCAFLSR